MFFRKCKYCGEKFETKWVKQIYCSYKCGRRVCKIKMMKDKKRYDEYKRKQRKFKKINYIRHKKDYATRARKSANKQYFGGLYEIVFKRDNGCCVHCGMTQKEHYKKYNTNIEMHHKDLNKNNNIVNNLEVVCKKCHNYLHKKYGNFIRNNQTI